jgi:hypothetical protein
MIVLSGCATKVTYDVSNAGSLENITLIDLRNKEKPAGKITSDNPERRYFGENAFGPTLIDILKSRLANHDSSLPDQRVITIHGIEISALPVDNSMGGNTNDPGATYLVAPIYIPSVGLFPLITGPSSNKSLVSVRAIIRCQVDQQPMEVVEYGMSKRTKLEPEIKKVFHKAIDRLVNQF